MKLEVTRVRLVLHLDVVRGRRWRDLAPFREAVLFHFTPRALREKVVALSEAVADQILEEVIDHEDYGEPVHRAHLRAVIDDLQHGGRSLGEVWASPPDEQEAPEEREAFRLALRLAKHLERALAEIERVMGPAPETFLARF